MTVSFRFDPADMPPGADALRAEVREFLQQERARGSFDPVLGTPTGLSRDFSRRVGARGWIGMTWPQAYGGHGRSQIERYIVSEEMLAARAPVRAHWVADRQSGPLLLHYGTEEMKRQIIPRIVRGEVTFCIGLSEPNSGSDVFASQTRADRVAEGWRINGTKLWTSFAHHADYMIGMFRTAPATKEDRRYGLSQFLVDMKTPGITVRPIINMAGMHDFNEVHFQDVILPAENLLGTEGRASDQATAELAYERSGPDRFLETFSILVALADALGPDASDAAIAAVGREMAHLRTLRHMSLSVAGMLNRGATPTVEGALVKDLGTNWEQALPGRMRPVALPPGADRTALDAVLRQFTLLGPKMTIQGGTREVLRGIIARGLGLR